jgi:hypothetical protein
LRYNYLQKPPQPASNPNTTQTSKSYRQHNQLVVVETGELFGYTGIKKEK